MSDSRLRLRPAARCALQFALAVLFAVTLQPAALADEGMWLVHDLDAAPFDAWRDRGLELTKAQIHYRRGPSISDAVIKLGGGTGTFVSNDGLIVTNHHVIHSALQRASTPSVNLMERGFIARSFEDEVPALGLEAYVLKTVDNVTPEVLREISGNMKPDERFEKAERIKRAIVANVEEGRDIHAEVRAAYGGREFYLYKYLKIRDIRIVYAPPRSIGVYGGEIDNWMWPRHTGDFAFVRAYIGPDGRSAEYSESNVPFAPRDFRAFATDPLAEGDFTMIIGYPARTRRHVSSFAVDHFINHYYPREIERYRAMLGIYEEESATNEEAAVKLAANIRRYANRYKNRQGMLEGLKKRNILLQKRDEEEQLVKFAGSERKRRLEYHSVIKDIGKAYERYDEVWEPLAELKELVAANSLLLSAYTLYNWSVEQAKYGVARDRQFQPHDEPRQRARLDIAARSYFEAADRRILAYYLKRLSSLDGKRRPESIDRVTGGKTGDELDRRVADFLDELYTGTRITDADFAKSLFGRPADFLRDLNDPAIEFAAAIEEDMERLERGDEEFLGAMLGLKPKLSELREMYYDRPTYPDANLTMRVSVGEIRGYSPEDGVTYAYLTTLAGVVRKHTGERPFDVPSELVHLHEAGVFGEFADPGTQDLPVNFLTTDDITGGNSGSAVYNGRGEIIGLVFDGNYESISSDYVFDPEVTRAICVDSRYILFLLERFAGARELLEELTVRRRTRG